MHSDTHYECGKQYQHPTLDRTSVSCVLKKFCLGAQYQELMTYDRCRWQSRWSATPPWPSGRQSPHSRIHICQPSEMKEIWSFCISASVFYTMPKCISLMILKGHWRGPQLASLMLINDHRQGPQQTSVLLQKRHQRGLNWHVRCWDSIPRAFTSRARSNDNANHMLIIFKIWIVDWIP